MLSVNRAAYKSRLGIAQLYEKCAHEILLSNYHPWQRYKRTVAMIGFFNVLFGPTVFGVIGQYKSEWLIAIEEAVGPRTLIFFPILNMVIIPALIGLLEVGLNYRFGKTVMPESDAQDRVPFVISLPGLEKLSHIVIGECAELNA